MAFIEILTNTEHIGLGETYAGYFLPEVVPQVVEFFRPIVIGQTVDNIPELWQRMYHCGNFRGRVGSGASILEGIEAAWWDLKGKLEGAPGHQLLGGSQYERLPCYATGGPSNYPEDHLARKLDHYLSLGFRAIKLGGGRAVNGVFSVDAVPRQAAEFEATKMAFARKHAGDDTAFMLNGHMGNSSTKTWNLETALEVAKALESFHLTFLEEPLRCTDLDGYAALSAAGRTPIAGGECLTTLCEWHTFIDRDCFHIGQSDASYLTRLGPFMQVPAM